MRAAAGGEPEVLRRRAQVFLLGFVADAALGVAAFLWGDLVLPATRVAVFGLTPSELIGAVFLFVAAPVQFLFYSRVKSRLERAVASSRYAPDRNGQATRD